MSDGQRESKGARRRFGSDDRPQLVVQGDEQRQISRDGGEVRMAPPPARAKGQTHKGLAHLLSYLVLLMLFFDDRGNIWRNSSSYFVAF